jgi:hypothetical protein
MGSGDNPRTSVMISRVPTPSRLWLPGVHESFNIQTDPETYEIENLALDPGGACRTREPPFWRRSRW